MLDNFKVYARLQRDLLQGDLKVFVYIAMGHGRKVGHLRFMRPVCSVYSALSVNVDLI